MERKSDVVELDSGSKIVVPSGVLASNEGRVVEGDIGDEIRNEAWDRSVYLAHVGAGWRQRLWGDETLRRTIPRTLMKGKSTVVPDVLLRRRFNIS